MAKMKHIKLFEQNWWENAKGLGDVVPHDKGGLFRNCQYKDLPKEIKDLL